MHRLARAAVVTSGVVATALLSGCSIKAPSCVPPKASPTVSATVTSTHGSASIPIDAHVGDTVVITARFTVPPTQPPTVSDPARMCIVSFADHGTTRTVTAYAKQAGNVEVSSVSINGPAAGFELSVVVDVRAN